METKDQKRQWETFILGLRMTLVEADKGKIEVLLGKKSYTKLMIDNRDEAVKLASNVICEALEIPLDESPPCSQSFIDQVTDWIWDFSCR